MDTRLTVPITLRLDVDDNDVEDFIIENIKAALRSFFVHTRNVDVEVHACNITRTSLFTNDQIMELLVTKLGRSTAIAVIAGRATKKISAVRAVVEHTNLSLARAKEFIETYAL